MASAPGGRSEPLSAGRALNVSFPDVPQPFAFDVRDGAGQLDWVTGGLPALVGRHDHPLGRRAEP